VDPDVGIDQEDLVYGLPLDEICLCLLCALVFRAQMCPFPLHMNPPSKSLKLHVDFF